MITPIRLPENAVQIARLLCVQVHEKQIDRDGQPHYEHSQRVASGMPTPELQVIALLHDALEDSEVLDGADIAETFGMRVCNAILALTRGEDEPWNSYMARVKENRAAVCVKIADIEDNIARCTEGDKMYPKLPMYHAALADLRALVTLHANELASDLGL